MGLIGLDLSRTCTSNNPESKFAIYIETLGRCEAIGLNMQLESS